MANLHLVTGYAGEAHITADDQGSLNAAVFGEGQFVLNRGNKFAATVATNNQIKVLDGDILMQGRHIRLNSGSFVELAIENGAQGYNRNDLIVARYTKNSGTGVEECNLVVIKGKATTGAASDPEYTSGDIMGGNALQNDMPLYRVPIKGLNVQELVPMFTVIDNRLVDVLAHTHEIADVENLQNLLNAKVPTSREIAGLALSSNITVAQLLAALAHTHAGTDLSSSVPITKGGTGSSDGATGLKNLFAAGYTVLSSNQYGTDFPADAPDGTLFFKEVE